jgi:hypothetical protein
MSDIDKANEKYRWYLCTQTALLGWSCEKKSLHEILNINHVENGVNSTFIPINKFIPHMFDNLIIKHNIRYMTHVTIKQ